MKKVFDMPGDFEARRATERWCGERGNGAGVMERGQPRKLLRGYWHIAKWRNLSGPEHRELDGAMIGDMRHGPVVVELKGEVSNG